MKDFYLTDEQLEALESASEGDGAYGELIRSLNISRSGLVAPLDPEQLEEMRTYLERHPDGRVSSIVMEILDGLSEDEEP